MSSRILIMQFIVINFLKSIYKWKFNFHTLTMTTNQFKLHMLSSTFHACYLFFTEKLLLNLHNYIKWPFIMIIYYFFLCGGDRAGKVIIIVYVKLMPQRNKTYVEVTSTQPAGHNLHFPTWNHCHTDL